MDSLEHLIEKKAVSYESGVYVTHIEFPSDGRDRVHVHMRSESTGEMRVATAQARRFGCGAA